MNIQPKLVDVTEIGESPFQPRSRYDLEALASLAADIAKNGIMQPPWVRPVRGKHPIRYELIFGHRRWQAAQDAGFAQIPVVIREVDDLEARRLALVENLESESLSDYDAAKAVEALWEAYNAAEGRPIGQTELCRRLNRSAQWLINRRKLVELPDDLQRVAQAHSGVMTQLFEINETRGELRRELISGFDTTGKKRLSVKDVRSKISDYERAHPRLATQAHPDRDSQQRRTIAKHAGSAPSSRGVTVTGPTARDASANAATAATALLHTLETLERWVEVGGRLPRADVLQAHRRLGVLLGES